MGHVGGKCSTTISTNVRLFSGVRHRMSTESLFTGKPRRTLITLVGLLVRMYRHVHLVVALGQRLLSAVLANVSLLGSPFSSGMQRQMFSVERLIGQEFVASGTLVEFSVAGERLLRFGGVGSVWWWW